MTQLSSPSDTATMSNNDTLTEAELQAITDQLLESLKTDFIGFAVATT